MKVLLSKPVATRRNLLTAVSVTILAYWLMLMAATASAPLHNWLHGGTTPQDDDCAVVMLATGKVILAAAAVLAIFVALAISAAPEIFPLPFIFQRILPLGRGPPSVALLPLR